MKLYLNKRVYRGLYLNNKSVFNRGAYNRAIISKYRHYTWIKEYILKALYLNSGIKLDTGFIYK